jgi:Meiotically up-regulated gene 113
MSNWLKPYVYVIGPMNRGPVKIGISGAPEGRLRELQTGHPEILCVLATFPGGEEHEQALHKFFAPERLQGEWFKRTPRVRKFIDMIACKVGPAMAMAACRPDKEKRQEQQKLKAEERKRARGRAELAKLIAGSNGRFQVTDSQGHPINVERLRQNVISFDG